MKRLPATLTLIALLLPATLAFSQDQAPDQAPPADPPPARIDFTPNPRYTVFEGPLREDGTIDYVAAVNERQGAGVSKETNAAAGLVMLFADSEAADDALALVIEELGITVNQLKVAPRYVDWDTYCSEHHISKERADDILTRHAFGPFDEGDGELVASWLASNEEAFQWALVSLAKPHFYVPLVVPDNSERMLLGTLMPHLGELRALARGMTTRIDMLVQLGDCETASKYVVALLRLASFQSQEPTVIQRLVGYSIQALALQAMHRIVTEHRCDAEMLGRLTLEWESIPDLGGISDAVALGERCMTLDSFMHIAFGRLEGRDGDAVHALFASGQGDINVAFQTINRQYVTLIQSMRAPTYKDYLRVQELVEQNYQTDLAQAEKLLAIEIGDMKLPLPGLGPEATGRAIGYQWLSMWYPEFGSSMQMQFAAEARRGVALIGIACERYRLATGRYPQALEELMPDYFDALPVDPMDGEPMRFVRDGTGIEIYSIYIDMEDDGGETDIMSYRELRDGDYAWRLTPPYPE